MSLQLCNQHNHLKEYICARNDCNQLLCKQCFKVHSQISNHSMGVRLSLESKQFFLRWTEFILKKIIGFEEIVTQMGYSKIFEMKLETNHPKGTVSQLNFQDIQKVAIQALEEHKRITEGNLIFIKGTQTIAEMIHPEFLKDLFNIVCEDAKYNLANLLTDFRQRLINAYPEKEIYSYANFSIISKEIAQVQEYRNSLVQQYEDRIMLRFATKEGEAFRAGSSQLKTEQGVNEFANLTDKQFSKDYHSASSEYLNTSNQKIEQQSIKLKQDFIQEEDNNMSTVSNPSPTRKQLREVEYTPRNLSQTISEIQQVPSHEQLATTISLLRSNELMYQEKIARLNQENLVLKDQLERLSKMQLRVMELEKQRDSQNHTQSQEKVAIELQSELQSALKKQIDQLQVVQANLIQQNSKLNHALKDMQDIAQGRSRTILQLQQQIKNMSDNIQLKEKSIVQLNKLISNQEEEISYRENQVQILGQEIKKLMDKIAFLEKSIHQLNNLVSNEEEEISYRENEVQTLEEEINKLLNRIKELEKSVKSLNSLIANEEEEITYRENETQILQKEVKKLLQKIAYLQKSIHQLNNLISNQEEEIAYRENETETLQNQVKKLVEKINSLQKSIHELNNLISNEQEEIAYRQNQSQNLTNEVTKLIQKNKTLQTQLTTLNQLNNELQTKLNLTQQQETLVQTDANQKIKLQENELQILNQRNKVLTQEIHLLNEKYKYVETELTNAVQKNTSQEIQLRTLTQNNTLLQTELNLVKSELINFKAEFNLTNEELNKLKSSSATLQTKSQQPINEQLLEQVVLLQAELKNKSHDISILINTTQELLNRAYSKQSSQSSAIMDRLRQLKTINIRGNI